MTISLIPRRDLFGNPDRTLCTISPDGRFLAWLAPTDGVLNVWVAPRDAPDDAHPVTQDRLRGIRLYAWTYDGRHLVYLQDVGGDENFHVHAVDVAARATRDLTPFPGVRADIARISRTLRDRILISMNRRDPRFMDLHTVDLATGDVTLIQESHGEAEFVTDRRYGVHMAVTLETNGAQSLRRRGPDGAWADWITFSPDDAKTSGPVNLDADATALFLSDSRGRDTAALVRIDLATGGTRVIAADPRADVAVAVKDNDTLEPLAYAVTVERRELVAIDPRIQPDLDFLAARDIGEWLLNSRTEDDRIWIVSGASDIRPGAAYLYDRTAKSLVKLYDSRPELAGTPLVEMPPVTIRSRDDLPLVCYLTRPADAQGPGPMVLLVHGGPWGRDVFGFNPYHQWLANRGYAVLSVNFRGSTGFGKAFVNAGDGEWGRRMDDDLLDAVAWAIAEGVADPARIAIMGGSYGGYAVLAGMTRNPTLYACGVDIVGPSSLETLIATIPPYWESIRGMFTRAIGDPATQEGLALMRERSPLHMADRIARPLLIAQGANDPRVKQSESDQMVAAMQAHGVPVTYVLFPDEGHGFARPENNIAFNAVTEAFLARHLGGRAEPMTQAERDASTMQVLQGGAEIGLP